jgi:hypothetical protein
VDLDGDGNNDIITGSYWPGDLYFFRGQKDGAFAKGEILKGADGKNLNSGGKWKSDQEPDMDSLASVPFAVDQDGDGDLDLLVGNIAGRVILIPNEGTKTKPAFDASKRSALEAGGSAIKVGGDSGPVVADWDHDGKPDLVIGAGDGAVWFFRNEGTKAAPKYAAGEAILPKSKMEYSKPTPVGQAPAGPGARTKVHVADWNGDGRVDLLVGDFWYEKPPDLKLTPEQVKRRDELKLRQTEMSKEYSQLWEKLGREAAKTDEHVKKLREELNAVYQELSKLEARPVPRGSVWLYLREAKKPATY